MIVDDGTLYEGKLSRTVWSGGKLGDNIKGLPITIGTGNTFCLSDFHDHRAALYLDSHLDLKSFSHNIVSIAYSMCGICSVELCLKPLYYSLDRV